MPYSPVLGDHLSVKFYFTNAEQTAILNTTWQVTSIGGAGFNQTAIANYFDALQPGNFKGWMSTDSTYYGTTVQRRFPLPIPPMEFSKVSAGAGLNAQVSLPRQSRGLMSFNTNFAGRAFRSRLYLAFPSSLYNAAGGVITPGGVAVLNLVAGVLSSQQIIVAGGNNMTLIPEVFHRRLQFGSPITLARPATNKWATQRRSGSYGRANAPSF